MVNFIRTQNVETGEINDIITGEAEEDAKEGFTYFENNEEPGDGPIPLDPIYFHFVYNDGFPYMGSHRVCKDKGPGGLLAYENQCAIRMSKAFRDRFVDFSSYAGDRCSHGDFRFTADMLKVLQDKYHYYTVLNPDNNIEIGKNLKLMFETFKESAIVVMIGYKDGNGNLGNHMEFVYHGEPKSKYPNVWSAQKFYVFNFKN